MALLDEYAMSFRKAIGFLFLVLFYYISLVYVLKGGLYNFVY